MRVVSLDAFKESLVEELGNKVAFTVPVLGGVPVAGSVGGDWVGMAGLAALGARAPPLPELLRRGRSGGKNSVRS